MSGGRKPTLALNARDAMPGGGAITLSAVDIMIDEAAASEEDTHEGDYVVLCVAGEGSGMSEEAKNPCLFFFHQGRGQGQGLGPQHGL